jgi:hypothetical protein
MEMAVGREVRRRKAGRMRGPQNYEDRVPGVSVETRREKRRVC